MPVVVACSDKICIVPVRKQIWRRKVYHDTCNRISGAPCSQLRQLASVGRQLMKAFFFGWASLSTSAIVTTYLRCRSTVTYLFSYLFTYFLHTSFSLLFGQLSMVGLALVDHRPSVLRHCWLRHLFRNIVFELTYNVSSGTLNPRHTLPYHTILTYLLNDFNYAS